MTELSDDLLVAYVDGRLGKEQKRAIAKVLDQDEVIAHRAKTLKDAHHRLAAAFDAILAGSVQDVMSAVPQSPPAPPRQGRNGLTRLGLATAGIGLALLLLVFGFRFPGPAPEVTMSEGGGALLPSLAWHERALIAHALLARESVDIKPENQSNRYLVGFQLARVLGPEARVPEMEPQGLTFMRGQVLRGGEKPMAQLVYLGETGEPIALYLMRDGGGGEEPVFRKEGSVRSLLWRHGELSHLLAGQLERSELERIAAVIRAAPPKADTHGDGAPDRLSNKGSVAAPDRERPGSDPIVTGTN